MLRGDGLRGDGRFGKGTGNLAMGTVGDSVRCWVGALIGLVYARQGTRAALVKSRTRRDDSFHLRAGVQQRVGLKPWLGRMPRRANPRPRDALFPGGSNLSARRQPSAPPQRAGAGSARLVNRFTQLRLGGRGKIELNPPTTPPPSAELNPQHFTV